MSEEQLLDEFKSAKHTESYIKFCDSHNMVKWDPKRECKVYYYEKKLLHWGSRDEGSLEKTHLCLGDDMAQSDEEDENSSSTDSDSSSPKKKRRSIRKARTLTVMQQPPKKRKRTRKTKRPRKTKRQRMIKAAMRMPNRSHRPRNIS